MALTRHETTSSSTVASGKTNRPRCARVKEVTNKGKQKWRVGDLLADESPAVLGFVRNTHVGRAAPPVGTVRMKRSVGGCDKTYP